MSSELAMYRTFLESSKEKEVRALEQKLEKLLVRCSFKELIELLKTEEYGLFYDALGKVFAKKILEGEKNFEKDCQDMVGQLSFEATFLLATKENPYQEDAKERINQILDLTFNTMHWEKEEETKKVPRRKKTGKVVDFYTVVDNCFQQPNRKEISFDITTFAQDLVKGSMGYKLMDEDYTVTEHINRGMSKQEKKMKVLGISRKGR